MKRRLLFVLVLALLLASLAGTAGAQSDDVALPIASPAALAAYFPEGSDIFVALRTDSGFAEEIDSVLAVLSESIPDLAGFNTQLLLDLVAFQVTGESYAQGVEPWLGDSVAVGLADTGPLLDLLFNLLTIAETEVFMEPGMSEPDATEEPGDMDDSMTGEELLMQAVADVPVVFGVEITDRAAAEAFFTGGILAPLGPVAPFDGAELDGFDLFMFENLPVVVALGDDAILLMTPSALDQTDFDAPLSADPEFVGTLEQLPADAYNLLIYTDAGDIAASTESFSQSVMEMAMMETGAMEGAIMQLMDTMGGMSMGDLLGPQAVGFTLLDGRSAVIDSVSAYGPAMMGMGMDANPIDPAFAANIPADAQLVIHDNGYGTEILSIFDALDTITPMIDAQIAAFADSGLMDDITVGMLLDMLAEEMGSPAPLAPVLRFLDTYGITPQDPVTALFDLVDFSDIQIGGIFEMQANALFGGLTGLNLTDTLSWMTGDYAIYMRLLPVASDLDFTIDVGFLTEVTDTEAVQVVLDGLEEAMQAYRFPYTVEEMGEGRALVLAQPVRFPLQMMGLPSDVLAQTPELDLVIAADESIYVNGSRAAAEFALSPEGETLADNPGFAYAAETLILEDSVAVWYVGFAPFVDALPALLEAVPVRDLVDVAEVASLLESATISSTVNEAVAITRLALTLEDDVTIPDELIEAVNPPMPGPEVTLEATEEAPEAEMAVEATEEAPEPEMTVEATEEAPEAEMTPEMTEEAPEVEATEESGD